MTGKTSKELFDQLIATQRQVVMAKGVESRIPKIAATSDLERYRALMVSDPSISDDEMLRRLTAATRQVPGAMNETTRSVGSVLGAASNIAMGIVRRVWRPKIWESDVARYRGKRFDRGPWMRFIEALALTRRRREPKPGPIVAVCAALAYKERQPTGTAMVRATYAWLKEKSGYSVDTIQAVIEWVDSRGAIDTFNVLVRVDDPDNPALNGVFRSANMYMLRMPDSPTTAADEGTSEAPVEALTPLVRLTAKLHRWASSFSLVARDWGLNATPLATHRERKERDPLPA